MAVYPFDEYGRAFALYAMLRVRKQIYYLHGSLVTERINTTARKYSNLITHLHASISGWYVN